MYLSSVQTDTLCPVPRQGGQLTPLIPPLITHDHKALGDFGGGVNFVLLAPRYDTVTACVTARCFVCEAGGRRDARAYEAVLARCPNFPVRIMLAHI